MVGRELGHEAKWKIVGIVGAVLTISSLHYATDMSQPLLHDIYRRLYYIPVALAAVWFGLRGGLAVSAGVAALYVPHIAMVWNDMGRELANRVMEVVLFFAFSGITGYFADQERRFRIRCQEAALNLERSYEKLREQADVLVETEEQLRRADRLAVIGQMTAGLTHEIRNPLGSIKGAAEILKDEFPPGHPKAEFLDILIREALQLNRVVEEFLGFARNQKEGDEEQIADLAALVRETVAMVEGQNRTGRVTIRNRTQGSMRVLGSPVQVKQVLLNLLLNAVQATGGRGVVSVRGTTKEGKVLGAEYREIEGHLAVVRIEDDGPGIAEGDLAKVFDPFYTTKKGGTGLGLAISQRIVHALGGTLTAENRSEGGSRFTLTLPMVNGNGRRGL